MVTIIFKKRKIGLDSALAIEIAKRLHKILGDKLVAVNTIDGFDGSNIRIVVKGKTFEDVKKIMKIIGEVEEEFDAHGKILPEVIDEEYLEILIDKNKTYQLSAEILNEIKKRLHETLGEKVIGVFPIDGFDGSNIRIVVRGKTFEDVKKIMKIIGEVEEEFDAHGKILPEITGEAFVEDLPRKD